MNPHHLINIWEPQTITSLVHLRQSSSSSVTLPFKIHQGKTSTHHDSFFKVNSENKFKFPFIFNPSSNINLDLTHHDTCKNYHQDEINQTSLLSRLKHMILNLNHFILHFFNSILQLFKINKPTNQFKSIINLYDYLKVEIEDCKIIKSNHFHSIHYQIFRRYDLNQDDIKADILYLPDSSTNSTTTHQHHLSPLIATLIHTGHRIIIPNLNQIQEISYNITHQTHFIALILQNLKLKDEILIKQKKSFLPINSSLLFTRTIPIFLFGLGHNALIALSYPIEISKLKENLSSSHSTQNSFSFNLFKKFKFNFKSNSHSFLFHNSLPEINAIISIGPTLQSPNVQIHQNKFKIWLNHFLNKSNNPLNHHQNNLNSSRNIQKVIENIHENSFKIKIPVLIAHGTKEVYGIVEGTQTLYETLNSTESSLIYCSKLGQSGNLSNDLNMNNPLTNECIMWIWERIHSSNSTSIHSPTTFTRQHNHHSRSNSSTSSSSSSSSSLTLTCDHDHHTYHHDVEEENDISHNNLSFFKFLDQEDLIDENINQGNLNYNHSTTRRNSILPQFLDSLFLTIDLNSQDDLSQQQDFNSSIIKTITTKMSDLLPSSLSIQHHPGPHYLVSVPESSRASVHSLCCENILE